MSYKTFKRVSPKYSMHKTPLQCICLGHNFNKSKGTLSILDLNFRELARAAKPLIYCSAKPENVEKQFHKYDYVLSEEIPSLLGLFIKYTHSDKSL